MPHSFLQHKPQQSSRWGISSFIQQCSVFTLTILLIREWRGTKRQALIISSSNSQPWAMKDSNDPSPSPLHSQQHPFLILIAEHQPRRPCHQFSLRKQHGRTQLRESVYSDWWRCSKNSTPQSRHWDIIRQCKMKCPPRKVSSPLCYVNSFPLLSLSDARRLQ